MPDWLPHQQINLGLDLQGGSHLLLEVDLGAVIDELILIAECSGADEWTGVIQFIPFLNP